MVSAGAAVSSAPIKAAAEPLMLIKGVRSSSLTMVKNSARHNSWSCNGVRS